MQESRVYFKHKTLPYILVAPQLIITLVFFIWPASQAYINPCSSKTPSG
jgi:sn-glycerol 3-phosphate transport system permease protein